MKKYILKTNLENEIIAVLNFDELIYGVTAVIIGCNSKYHKPSKEGVIDSEYALHPLTGEKLDIIAIDDSSLENEAVMMVPAHIQDHFELAKKYKLKFKQVVAPYFLGINEETPKDNVETVFRRSIIAVIKDNESDKYLCVSAKKRFCNSFVMGGIENDETPEQAALREVEEETGYCDVEITDTSIFVLHNHFYAGYKGVNRYAHLYVIRGNLLSDKRNELNEEESEKQSTLWLSKEELKDFLSVNNNIFVYNEILDSDKAFENNGVMMNSNEYDGKMRDEV